MGWFGSRPPQAAPRPTAPPPSQIPILPVDLSKRYDVYCSEAGHDRLYEDVRFVCIRTFDRITEFSSGLVGGYLEVELPDGTQFLIPGYGVRIICEHGKHPVCKIMRHRRSP